MESMEPSTPEVADNARHRHRTATSTARAIQSQPSPYYSQDTSSSKERSQFLVGLTIAGLASALLTTIFGLFSVDVFLRVFDLDLGVYATGNVVFSILSTCSTVVAAWIVDSYAHESSRSSIIGVSGCIFAVLFTLPFFRWQASRGNVMDGAHFVLSMSLYDSMYSFVSILLGSIVTDDHTMTDSERIRFMASGKVLNLVASFVVARIGLEIFDDNDADTMSNFRTFVIIICILACSLFSIAQLIMTRDVVISWKTLSYQHKLYSPTKRNLSPDVSSANSKRRHQSSAKRKLQLRQVLSDFIAHKNFCAWIKMEMLLECQTYFLASFSKTFIDRLVVDAGVSRDASDWLLSLIDPMKQIAAILCYWPIRRRGYRQVYTGVFWTNLILSIVCLAFASESNPYMILAFLLIHIVMTGAMQSAGFHLAMSDMVLEMKRKHVLEGRVDEPSLAGLFIGFNALLCKPMASFLPIVAAFLLESTDFSSNEDSEPARRVLYYLLVVPPILFSCLQILSWKRYNLYPERTDRMRLELDTLLASSSPFGNENHLEA